MSDLAEQYPIILEMHTGEELIYQLDPEQCAGLLDRAIGFMLGKHGEEKNPEAAQKARGLRVVVKGALIAFGPAILKVYMGPNHPKPGKSDDIVDWYCRILARIAIAHAMRSRAVLTGERNGNIVKITEIGTRPNPGGTADENPGAPIPKLEAASSQD